MRLTVARHFQVQTLPPTKGSPKHSLASLVHSNAPINYLSCGHLIQYCSDRRLLLQTKQIHARLVVLNVTPDNFIASKLISFYSKSGSIALARHVFDEIPHKNTFSFNAMLFAYSYHGLHLEVIKLFSSLSFFTRAIKPDNFTITSLLKSLSSHSWAFLHPSLGKEIQGFSLRHGFDSDVFVSNALVTFYSRATDLGLARKVFDRMPERDIVSWNSMISGYSQSGECEPCFELYRTMGKASGLKPNSVTVVGVLQACSQMKNLIFGMELHKFVVENEIEIDGSLWNALISFYAKCGSLDYARELFDEVNGKDEVTYGAMISGYMSYGFVEKGVKLFQRMDKPGLSTWNAIVSGLAQNSHHTDVPKHVIEMQANGFRPNSVTLASVLPTFSYFSNLLGGKQIHGYAIRNDYNNNIYVVTALIDVYAKCGFLNGAQLVFAKTTARSVIVWTAIVSAYAAHGDADATLTYFDKMLKSGIRPDQVTFTAVLTACAHVGAVKAGQRVFETMQAYEIEPTVEHYACMVGALSRARMLHEAVDMIDKMPSEPNEKVWGALLNGASISCDVEIGKFAFDHLIEIEPESTGNYIIMANIYSRAKKWEEAEKVREKMKKMGLKKIPGCSWIETKTGLHSFVAGDTSNWKSEELYEILEGLVGVMREEGYVFVVELDEETVNT